MVPPKNICKVGLYLREKGESHGVRLSQGGRQIGGHRARQPLRARLNMQGFPSQIVPRMPDSAEPVLQSVFVSQIPVVTMQPRRL